MVVKKLAWLSWFLGLVLNAYLALLLASEIGFPLWIVALVLLVMEGVPLLWILNIIRKTAWVDRNFIAGYWAIWQILIFVFCVVACVILPCYVNVWSVMVKVIGVAIIGTFMYARTMSMATLLSKYSE